MAVASVSRLVSANDGVAEFLHPFGRNQITSALPMNGQKLSLAQTVAVLYRRQDSGSRARTECNLILDPRRRSSHFGNTSTAHPRESIDVGRRTCLR